jgi:hypothetical protein
MRTTMQDNAIYLPEHPVWGTALAVLDGEPVWPQRGAADDDDNEPEIDLDNPTAGGTSGGGGRDILDDELDNDDEEPDDEVEDKASAKKPDEDPLPATVSKADFDRVKGALDRERKLRKRRDAELAEAKNTKPAGGTADEEAAAQQAREAEERAEAKFKPIAIRASVKAALVEAGFTRPTKARISAMIGRMNMEEIELDEDDEVLGLEGEVDRLKEEFPELFPDPNPPAPATPAPKKTPRVSTSNKPPVEQKPKTTGEAIAAKILSGQS